MHTISHWITDYGYGGLFALLVLGIVGVPIPDETLLTFVGFLAYKGEMHFWSALVTAFVGSCCGITLSYVLGCYLGGWLIHRYGYWVHLTPQRIERVHCWFEKYGKWTLTFGYFVPGFRHLTAYAAGMTTMRYGEFAAYAYVGAAIWATSFLCLGYYLGPGWRKALRYAESSQTILLCVVPVVIAIALIVWFVKVRRRKARDQGVRGTV
jgi:membrane protein DedA with SNARE-associated domain